MTKKQKAFIEAVDAGTRDLKFFSVGGCDACAHCNADTESEFSWSSCDTCGSTLGGSRHPAHYVDDTMADRRECWTPTRGYLYNPTIVHLDVCEDCFFYVATGDLPE